MLMNCFAVPCEGRLGKYFEEVAFLEQKFVIDESKKIKSAIADAAKAAR